jgi:hypothetical protein
LKFEKRRLDMSEKEKKIAENLAETFDTLPDSMKERLLGYAEGAADMKAKMEEKKA